MKKFPSAPGAKLANGAYIMAEDVIDVQIGDRPRESIVLAFQPESYTPFVVWRRTVFTEAPTASGGTHVVDQTFVGDYHRTLWEAIEGYDKRRSRR
jgi:hypothetical protein